MRLKPLFVLILTALGLLLSTAKKGKNALSKNIEKLKKKIASSYKRDTAYPENDRSQEVTGTLIQIPDSILQEYRANQKQQEHDNKLNRWIALLAVLGAWIYAGIAAFQYSAMNETLKETAREFNISHRPWVSLLNHPEPTKLWFDDSGPHVEVRFNLVNRGTAPAIAIVVNANLITREYWDRDEPFPECADDALATVVKERKGGDFLVPQMKITTPEKPIIARKGEHPAISKKQVFLIGCLGYYDDSDISQPPPHKMSFVEFFVSETGKYFDPSERKPISGHFETVGWGHAR
jgi:hypothetical protein